MPKKVKICDFTLVIYINKLDFIGKLHSKTPIDLGITLFRGSV